MTVICSSTMPLAENEQKMFLEQNALSETIPSTKTLSELVPLDDIPDELQILHEDIQKLSEGMHPDPFSILGVFFSQDLKLEKTKIIVRTWIQNAQTIHILPKSYKNEVFSCNNFSPMIMLQNDRWIFAKCFETTSIYQNFDPLEFKFDLKVQYYSDNTTFYTPVHTSYIYGKLLPDYDLKLFQSGSFWHVDDLLGSHIITMDGVTGVRFSVWAPNCHCVSVVGDWNSWDSRAHPMRKRVEFGVWELFVPNVTPGSKYGYHIRGKNGKERIKIDPYAQEFENPPKTASIVSACDDSFKSESERFQWTDDQWVKNRVECFRNDGLRRNPMSIYEVHLPSWMRGDNNSYLGYRELADRLASHVKSLNFTHVEFLPLAQHPFEGSWGYQVMGQYAPYSRLGTPDDFKYLVNHLHGEGIGVFLDCVPGHFCKDDWGLVEYDGEPCYEYSDPREGEHRTWGTKIFNFRRTEVRCFLLGAAYHWLRRYHLDGLRIDAVSSMIYKNHCRSAGDWIPNEQGGDANLQAVSLLQEMNWVIHREFPGVFMMAEESTSWKGVTDPENGLGFDAKWDLGWMNDTLSYLCSPFEKRAENHQKLTFRGLYMAHEHWILPLSHDEVVSGKGSLVDKCGYGGVPFIDRLMTLKTLYAFQIGLPGRPLLFMGGEFAQGREWKPERSIDWHECSEPNREKCKLWLSDLLAVYKHHKALHAGDDETWNFKWTDCENTTGCIAFIRSYIEWHNDILVVCNFSTETLFNYPIGVPHGGQWQVLLNSDDWRYGGSMKGPGNLSCVSTTQGGRLGWPYCIWIDVPRFSALYLRPFVSEEKKTASSFKALTSLR